MESQILDFGVRKEKKQVEIWIEKYRPKILSDFIGNAEIKEAFSQYIETNDPPHILLYGPAGTGKTTLAKILMNTLKCDYLYINASDYSGIDVVRNKIKPFCESAGFSGLKLVVLDEADGLTPNAQASLRNIMETYIKHARFLLTCNYLEKIIDPIISRTNTGLFEVKPTSKKECAVRIKKILDEEGVEANKPDIAMIVNAKFPDLRATLGTIQKHISNKKLVISESELIRSDSKLKFINIFDEAEDPKSCFKEVRQYIADERIRDFTDYYRLMYDNVDKLCPGRVGEAILTISSYQMKDSLVIDKEIPFMAMCLEIITIKFS